MLETIYVVRHAFRSSFTVNPQTGEYTSSPRTPTGIPTDPPLTAHGVAQAVELADHLTAISPPIDKIYSSPFYRCLQTLKPTTERLFKDGKAGGRVRLDRGLGEFFGKAPFTHPTPPTLAILGSHFVDLDEDYASVVIPHANGEMILELHDRVASSLHHIISSLDADPSGPKTLLICTHAATMICIGRVLTGNMPDDPDEDDFQCYTASLSTYKRKADAILGVWDCTGNAETGFLSGGPERGWKFNGDESFVSFPEGVTKEFDGQSPKL